MLKAKYVIVGNSIAAIHAVEGIRERDAQGSIVLISDEACPVYSRPLISYWLGGKVTEDRMAYRPPSFYDDHNVQAILGQTAVRLDPHAKKIILEDQTEIRFDKLLLATGGSPFIPDMPGRELQGIFSFTTIEDAKCLKEFIQAQQVKKAVVLGGGLIGLKATEALIALNVQVTIIELADRILSATFDLTASRIIENALNEIGCSIITSNTVRECIEGEKGKVGAVMLKDGAKIGCDLVITAIGVRPRVDLVKGTPIKVNKGILVDRSLQTSIQDIYAAGDVIESFDLAMNAHRPVATLLNASRQGRIAGHNMAGGEETYEGCLAMNAVELANVPTISVGLTDPSLLSDPERLKDIEVLQDFREKEALYKKIIIEGHRIIGVILIGRIDRAGIYTGLIKDKVDISSVKDHLLLDDFGLLSLPKAYRKHLVTGQGIEV
jgi:NAD(P)H-nitrite reductase large subunit